MSLLFSFPRPAVVLSCFPFTEPTVVSLWFSLPGPAVVLSCFSSTGPTVVSLNFPFSLEVQSQVEFTVVVAMRTENPGQRPISHWRDVRVVESLLEISSGLPGCLVIVFSICLVATPNSTDNFTTICSSVALHWAFCCSDWSFMTWRDFWSHQHRLCCSCQCSF